MCADYALTQVCWLLHHIKNRMNILSRMYSSAINRRLFFFVSLCLSYCCCWCGACSNQTQPTNAAAIHAQDGEREKERICDVCLLCLRSTVVRFSACGQSVHVFVVAYKYIYVYEPMLVPSLQHTCDVSSYCQACPVQTYSSKTSSILLRMLICLYLSIEFNIRSSRDATTKRRGQLSRVTSHANRRCAHPVVPFYQKCEHACCGASVMPQCDIYYCGCSIRKFTE